MAKTLMAVFVVAAQPVICVHLCGLTNIGTVDVYIATL